MVVATSGSDGAQGTVGGQERREFFRGQRNRTLLPALQALCWKFCGCDLRGARAMLR